MDNCLWFVTGFAIVLAVTGAVEIKECRNDTGWLEIREDFQSTITCEGFSSNQTVTWTLSNGTGQQVQFTCSDQQCASADSEITLTRSSDGTGGTISVLTITANKRTKAGNGTITCEAQGQAASCRTNVISPARVYPQTCTLSENVSDWTITGQCSFDTAHSSNGTYLCSWSSQNVQGQNQQMFLNDGIVSATEIVKYGSLYHEGNCTLPPSPLPSHEGDYIYSVHFNPGVDATSLGRSYKIQSPGDPTTTCPHYIHEGQQVLCNCQLNPAQHGSPPAIVQWRGLNPGAPLNLSGPLGRNDTGRTFSCDLSWGPLDNLTRLSVDYVLDVAYGPDNISLKADSDDLDSSGEDHITLVCRTYNYVHPGVLFVWTGVNCSSVASVSGQTGHNSTCTFVPTADNDGDVVTCVAKNSQFPDRFFLNATYTIEYQYGTTLSNEQTNAASTPSRSSEDENKDDDEVIPLWGIIVAVVGGLILISVAIFIIIRKIRQ